MADDSPSPFSPLAIATRYADLAQAVEPYRSYLTPLAEGAARAAYPLYDAAKTAWQLAHAGELTNTMVAPYLPVRDGEWAVPPVVTDTGNALMKLGRAGESMFGAKYAPADVYPTNYDANLIAGLAMTGGLAGVGSRSVSGRALEDVAASRPLASSRVEAGSELPTFTGPRGYGLQPLSGTEYYITKDGMRIGDATIDAHGNTATINTIHAGGPNRLGVEGLRDLREAYRGINPDVVHFQSLPGDRISGARNGPAAGRNDKTQKVTLFSNPKEAAPVGMAVANAGPQTIRAYHGTNERFSTFDPTKTKEVGFHFGSKATANARELAKNGLFSLPWPLGKGWRNIPVDIEANKIADLTRDPAGFGGYSLAKQLVDDGIAPPDLLKSATHLAGKGTDEGRAQATAMVRQWLTDNGYDVVRYPNSYEGGGSSYMTMGTGNVRHARTGEMLFANPSEGIVPAMSTTESEPSEQQGRQYLLGIAGRYAGHE